MIGARCAACGALFQPVPRRCPECLGERLDRVTLAPAGTVRTTATIDLPPPGAGAPYAVAWVDLDDGVRLFGRLEGAATAGDRVRVTPDARGLPIFEATA